MERRLPGLLPAEDERPESVHRAMRYAALGAGKRVRPVLTLAVVEMFGGGDDEAVVDVACAVELVHASSLVLDDLPSMDDAELRRGRPTVHRAFGEATAILAAFGLLNLAFQRLADAAQRLALSRYAPEDLVHHLADAIGTAGLIGGQTLDLESTPADLPPYDGGHGALERLEYVHSHKTGALFLAAGELGAMAADARRRDLESVGRYAKNLGLAFQIEDDLLDALATPEETGKDVRKDTGKTTFVSLLGVDGARALADELLAFAIDSLEPLGRRADPLRALAEFVAAPGRR
ncbi:MAG: farnesyl diphosphate synthase [Acidobacteriota bacterium]